MHRHLPRLQNAGAVFACACSRKDIAQSIRAPHALDEEPIYPGTCRRSTAIHDQQRIAWRFRVPDGERIRFVDANLGRRKTPSAEALKLAHEPWREIGRSGEFVGLCGDLCFLHDVNGLLGGVH